ncbi:hypothetical protein B0F90DRAFT_1667474 [Multifurca ochricompacta]|uniref:RING-type domain-containing protein n=1 Tax=Multifurca ochricompacta TaxID=376703 RepID=A0AAD4M5F1_9AGAM|nr:hypothetical protein B0F90DRAFT_1667474 [Multifurca ochricompacta]
MFHGLSAGNQDAGVSGLDKRALSPELVNEILKGAGHTFHYHVLRRRQMTSTPNLQATRSQLSALNFVRLSVSKGLGGTRYEIPPLQEVLSQENAEAAVSVCNGWDNDHLMDFEDFFRIPLFLLTLHIRTTKFCRPSDEEFKALLAELNSLTTPAGLVIVLKSDAIACVKPRFSTRGVLVTFHANLNKYPYSVRLSADTSLESVARQLGTHSPAAAVTVSDEGLKQQAEFLDNFTAYVLVPRKVDINSATLTESLIKSSLTILSLRTEVENLRSRKLTLARDTKSLEAKLEETAKRYDYYERQNRTIENRNHSLISAMGVSSSSPGSPHDRHHLSKYKSQSLVPDSFSSLSSSSFPSPSSTFTSHRLTSGNGVLSEFGIEFDDNLEYAMALQREFDEENLILAAERDRVVRDVEETMMMCNMCYKARSEDSIIRMDPCGHAFCPDCLRNHVVWELNGRHFPVLCPACRLNPTNEQEANVVTDKMVLELGIRTTNMTSGSNYKCLRFRCENFVFVDRQDVEERTVLLCPISSCDNIWCKLCQTAITVGGRRPQQQQQQQQQQQRRPWDYQTGPVDPFSKIEERRERLRREQEEHAQWHHRQQSSAGVVQGTRVGGGGFTITVPNFLGALVRTIHVPIENAISSVIRLGDSILKLSENYRHNNHQRTIITTMIGTTRALALRSQREFRSIHERTMEALELTSEINVEITYWITLTEIYLRGLQESYHLLHLLAISHDHSHSFSSFSSQETTNIQLSEERIYIALQDCENVKKEFQFIPSPPSLSRTIKEGYVFEPRSQFGIYSVSL